MTIAYTKHPISDSELRRRMFACWLGKSIGGTLGMPFEGMRDTRKLTFYDPVPTEMQPNDDLDLQVVYVSLLLRQARPRIEREALAEVWQYVRMSPDEYGIVKRNLQLGLLPPTTGTYDNTFPRGMGAAIRTELWACLAAGDPDLAVRYAYEDACADHCGEGIDAAMFLAAIEAAAFVETDIDRLLDIGLSYLPSASELTAAVRDTRQWWDQTRDWQEVRLRLIERYYTANFTDVVLNLSYITLGLLAGGGDFGKSICVAVNCGDDSDCTGATLGALAGILWPDRIEEKWKAPIGTRIVLSPTIEPIEHASTLEEFTDQVMRLRDIVKPPTLSPTSTLQSTDPLAIRATVGWRDSPLTDIHEALGTQTWLAGTMTTLHTPQDAAFLIVQYPLTMASDFTGLLMFNTDRPVRVWFDGRLITYSAGGPSVPAFHRCEPTDQIQPIECTAGSHYVTAEIEVRTVSAVRWVIGICHDDMPPVCRRWLLDPFIRRGLGVRNHETVV